jgi:uncharacterized protein YndB with AHSA1/START domain
MHDEMFWFAAALFGGCFGLVVAAAVVAGVLNLVFHRGQAVAVRCRFARPPAEVWAALADFAAHPSWRSDVDAVERRPARGGREVWAETDGEFTTEFCTEVAEAPRRLVRVQLGSSEGRRWEWEISPVGTGSLVTVTETDGNASGLGRLLGEPIIRRHRLVRQLRELGAKLGVPAELTE